MTTPTGSADGADTDPGFVAVAAQPVYSPVYLLSRLFRRQRRRVAVPAEQPDNQPKAP